MLETLSRLAAFLVEGESEFIFPVDEHGKIVVVYYYYYINIKYNNRFRMLLTVMGMFDWAERCCHVTNKFSIFICFSISKEEKNRSGHKLVLYRMF